MSDTATTEYVVRLNDLTFMDLDGLHQVPTPNAEEIAEETAWLFPLGELHLSKVTALLAQSALAAGDPSVTRRMAYALAGHLTGKLDDDATDVAHAAYTEAVTGEPGHQVVSMWLWPGSTRLLYSLMSGIDPGLFPEGMLIVTSADRSRTVVMQSTEVRSLDEAAEDALLAAMDGGQQG